MEVDASRTALQIFVFLLKLHTGMLPQRGSDHGKQRPNALGGRDDVDVVWEREDSLPIQQPVWASMDRPLRHFRLAGSRARSRHHHDHHNSLRRLASHRPELLRTATAAVTGGMKRRRANWPARIRRAGELPAGSQGNA